MPYGDTEYGGGMWHCKFCGKKMLPGQRDFHQCGGQRKIQEAKRATRNQKRSAKLRAEKQTVLYRNIAFRQLCLQESAPTIAEALNVTLSRVSQALTRREYKKIYAELSESFDEKQKAVFTHVEDILRHSEVVAARRIKEILEETDIDPKTIATLAKLSTDVVKMRGHDAPKKSEVEMKVSLSEDSVRLLQQANREIEEIDAIDLDDSEWSYAMSETERAGETKHEKAPRPSLPSPPEDS